MKGLPCVHRKYKHGYVCVCNSTYCDSYEKIIPDNRKGMYVVVSSSKVYFYFNLSYFFLYSKLITNS